MIVTVTCDNYPSQEVAGQGAATKDARQRRDRAKQGHIVRDGEDSVPCVSFMKTKSGLASTAPSVLSFRNKKQEEMMSQVVSDLRAPDS